MDRQYPPMPTGEQCEADARLPDYHGRRAYACWYPQMGGYCGKCVVLISEDAEVAGSTCFDAYVWHDGEFPFHENDDIPVRLHHCEPSQFIEFGKLVQAFQEAVNKEK